MKALQTFKVFYYINMKQILLTIIIAVTLANAAYSQQKDTIFIKGGQQVFCNNIKATKDVYSFSYNTTDTTVIKTNILKLLVDSIHYFTKTKEGKTIKIKGEKLQEQGLNTPKPKQVVENDSITEQANKEPQTPNAKQEEPKPWNFKAALGINLGNVLDLNNPTSNDKSTFTLNTSLDLQANYKKQGKRFEITNELHYIFGLQKEGLKTGNPVQRVQDDLATLHDISVGIDKKNKWNYNTILKLNTSIFTIYNGDYFNDENNLGRIQAFASPYSITISPGLKYEASNSFRFSISPYSFQLYGIANKEITNKGIFITELDGAGNYKNFLFKRLGAEVNFWFDKNVKQWLEMQYRLSFSSDYVENFGNNGLMDGLFITKFTIFKNIYLTHRATLKNNLTGNFLKPYLNQNILVTYAKTF